MVGTGVLRDGGSEGCASTAVTAEVDRQWPVTPWHLFRVDCSDEGGRYVFIVSAESDSVLKARELAEACVLEMIGTDERLGQIMASTFIGRADGDVFEKIGPV